MAWYLHLFVLIAVVIVTGNVTVLVVFSRTPTLRKRKHFLLVSLTVADLLVGTISVPMFVTMALVSYKKSIFVLYLIQDTLFGTASVFGLAAVAIERAYAVYFPFKHRILSKGVYIIGIAVIWVMAGFLAISSTYYDGLFTIRVVLITAPIILSLVVIMISYLLIWVKMNCMISVQGHANHERDNRLTVTLLMVTIISMIAWIPLPAVRIYGMFCGNICLIGKESLLVTVKFLHYGNSLVNPIIYALCMPQFKRAVFNAVRCCKQDQHEVQVPMIDLNTTVQVSCHHVVRDEKQLNENTSQVYRRDGIPMNENKEEDTSL